MSDPIWDMIDNANMMRYRPHRDGDEGDEMSEEPKLTNCPFCGCERVELWHEKADDVWDYRWTARCDECGAETSGFDSKEGAAEAWNRRTHGPATKAVLANIVKVLTEPPGWEAKVVRFLVPDPDAFLREQGAE